jgi:hypothetical protein
MKVVRLSAMAAFILQEIFLELISVRHLVYLRAIMLTEGF